MVSAHNVTVKVIQLSVLLFLSILYLAALNSGIRYPPTTDFAKFYASAGLLRDGREIYTPIPHESLGQLPPGAKVTRDVLHPNLNLPIVTAFFLPLTYWDYCVAFIVWSILCLLSGLGAILLVASKLQRGSARRLDGTWLAIFLLSYYPTWTSFRLGQVSLPLFLLLAVGWAAAREGKARLAGLAIGLALLLKVFVFLIVAYLLACRRWGAATWSLGVFIVGILVSLSVFGVDQHLSYLETIRGITWWGSNWNQSLLGFFTRVFGGSENIPAIDSPGLGKALSYGISLVLVAKLMWSAWCGGCNESRRRFDLGFGLALVIMLLVSPLGWIYYSPVLFITFFTAGRVADVGSDRWTRLAILLAFALSATPTLLVPSAELNSPLDLLTWASLYFYSLIALTVILVSMLRNSYPNISDGFALDPDRAMERRRQIEE